MQQHPDFGRGRLRYNGENKQKIVSIINDNYIYYKYVSISSIILNFIFVYVIYIV